MFHRRLRKRLAWRKRVFLAALGLFLGAGIAYLGGFWPAVFLALLGFLYPERLEEARALEQMDAAGLAYRAWLEADPEDPLYPELSREAARVAEKVRLPRFPAMELLAVLVLLGLLALGLSGHRPGLEAQKALAPPPVQEAGPKTPPEPEKAGSERVLKGRKAPETPRSKGPGEPAAENEGKPGAKNAGPPQDETKASDGSASKAPAKGRGAQAEADGVPEDREAAQAEPSAGEKGEAENGALEKAAAGGDAKEKPLPSAEASGEGSGAPKAGAGREGAPAGATGAPMAAEDGAEGALQAADMGNGAEAAGAQGKGVPGDSPDVRGGGATPGAGLAQKPGADKENPAAAPQGAPLPAPWPEGKPPEKVRRRAERYLSEVPLDPAVRELVTRYFELSSP